MRPDEVARGEGKDEMATLRLCKFKVGELVFGLPVDRVQEVVRTRAMTRVPLTSSVIGGLLNLRGEVVLCVDLRQWLAVPEASNPGVRNHIIVPAEREKVSLLVDAIGDIVEIEESVVPTPPDALVAPLSDLTEAIYGVDDELLLLLNVDTATGIDPVLHRSRYETRQRAERARA